MLSLSAKLRTITGKKVKVLRKKGVLPAVLYGQKIKSLSLEIDLKEFEKIYKEAGESSLVSLSVKEPGGEKKYLVLIHGVAKNPLTYTPIHVDFYQPDPEKKVDVSVPVVFEGEAPAVKELGGTLLKQISELTVRALPQHLPREVRISVEGLKTFEDAVAVKDLKLPAEVQVAADPEDVLARVAPPEKVEEELEKPIEEKVEEVEKVEEKEKEEEAAAEKPKEAEETKEAPTDQQK
jgi:large subunit ribosomal protein L25